MEVTSRRVESLSDGVFAIAITLLVLNVRLPHESAPVAPQIRLIGPAVAAYILSFVIVGNYWVAHHTMLTLVKEQGRELWWPNLLVLLVIAFVPFPAGVLGTHPLDAGALRLYGTTLCCANISNAILWATAWRAGRFSGVSDTFVGKAILLHLAPIVLYVAGMVVAQYVPGLTLLLFSIVPIFFITSAPWLPELLGLRPRS